MDLYIIKVDTKKSIMKDMTEYCFAFNAREALETVIKEYDNPDDTIVSLEIVDIIPEREIMRQEVR